MARKAKFGKKNISIVNRFRRFFNLDEEISQTALSRSARSHLHETTGEANLASYNKTYKEQIAASFQYEHEAPFNYDSKGFESNIAKNFLEGYPGNNPYPLLGTPYCAHDSIRAKEMRAELAAKITRFEAALEQDIEAGVSQERLTTAKAGFMDEIDDFLSACDAEIKNRGPLPPGEAATSSTLFNVLVPPVGLVNFGKAAYNDLSNAATEAAYYAANRYSFEKFKTDLDTHFTQKLDATRQLVESFQLWDPAQLRFDEKDYDATGKTSLTAPQQKAYNDLTAIKKDYDEALFTLLNSLDNDPRLVLKIKALEHATKAAVRKCMDYNRSVTITVADPRYQVNIAASVDSTATAATATTKPPPLENYLDAKLPSLTQAAVDLRVKMNAQFQTPKSRLQQWRFEYDNDSEHKLAVDKALNDPHKTFTDATEAALTAIQALTPKSSNDLALAVHIGKTGSEDGFSQATATTNDTSLTEYQAFAKNEGGVKKPEALSDNPTEKEKTAYETKKQAYAADRSTKLTSLETTHTEEVNRLRKRLFEPKEPEAPSTTTPEQTAATAKYHGAKKLYEEYTKSFDQKKPAPLADNADTAAKEAHATQTKTYEQALTVYQTRQKELETELTTANTPTDETELNNYKKAQEELEQSNKIHAFYHPEETALPDGPNFAQFSAEYHNVSAQLVSLQTDYKDASRKLLAIEFRWDPAQAKTDLATLEADYDRQLKQKTAALDNLNKKVSNFKSTSSDHAIQAAIKTNQDTFINQINTLKQAQKTAFDATTTAAAAERDKADKACQEYHLKYRIYCLQNGPLTGPLTDAQKQAIKKIEPKELLENLSTDPLIDKSLRLGLVSIKANKVNGKTVYRINLTEISSLAAAKNRNSDGTTKTAAFCSYLWSKKSRSEAIRAALNNPDVINDVGIAVDLIMAAKKDPNDKTYRSTFPAYNPDNYNTMLATSMACIAKGIEFNPEKDFDRSFKGASYEASHVNYITGALKDPKRQRIREKYLATIAAYEETFRSAQAFNNVCREVLDGGLKPGDAKDARENPEVARMKKPQQLFIQAVTNFSHHKNTTATKLANLNTLASSDDRNKIFQESITQLKYMDLATIKGLVPDGAGNHGHAAALMGMVLDRRSASDILAMKEREICHLYEALAKKDLGDKHEPVRQQVKQLQQQLKEDYRHIIHLADAQGLNAPEFKQQYQAALQRLFRAEVVSEQTFNAITDGIADIGRTATDTGNEVIQSVASWVHGEPTYGSALPKVDEKLTVDALSSKGYAAEKELEKFTWPIASASSSSEEAAIGALNTLATLSGDIREAREVSAKLVDNRLDTDFTQKVLNDIEAASKETLLETDRLAAIAKLNEALATLKKTQPAATNTQATEAFNAEEALLEAKKAVIEDLTARITAVKSTIASTREAIEKHKAELTGLLPQSAKPPVNFKENFTQLQDLHTLDTELKTLSKKNTTLNTQKMEINALGIKILPEKIKLINAISRAITES